jgi:hypothetical protein
MTTERGGWCQNEAGQDNGKEYKRRGEGGGRFDRRGEITTHDVTTFPGRATFHAHYKMTGKCPLGRLRWPSGPSANKTRPHLGLFLHIRS